MGSERVSPAFAPLLSHYSLLRRERKHSGVGNGQPRVGPDVGSFLLVAAREEAQWGQEHLAPRWPQCGLIPPRCGERGSPAGSGKVSPALAPLLSHYSLLRQERKPSGVGDVQPRVAPLLAHSSSLGRERKSSGVVTVKLRIGPAVGSFLLVAAREEAQWGRGSSARRWP